MANNTTVTMELDMDALRAVVLKHKGTLAAVKAHALGKQADIEVVGANYYQAALNATQELLNDGIPGADAPRKQLRVRNPNLPGGRGLQVQVDWKPLSLSWRENKQERAQKGYGGKLRSIGPRVFWLDTGELRTAFAGWLPGKAGMIHSQPKIRQLSNGDFQITHPLAFRKLSPAFLDHALRRALIAGAAAGRRVVMPEPLRRTKSRDGLYRASLTEIRRPMMRPLAIRLGREMQKQLIKILRRR